MLCKSDKHECLLKVFTMFTTFIADYCNHNTKLNISFTTRTHSYVLFYYHDKYAVNTYNQVTSE